MHYQNGTQKLIEGMPHFWDGNQNGWVNPNTGFVLSEQQVQEMSYMMYSEDSYDLPQPFVQEATSGTGTWKAPAKPAHYIKDYNTLILEAVGHGGTGGSVFGAGTQTNVWGNGGGAGAYSKIEIAFTNAQRDSVGMTVDYNIGKIGVTLDFDAQTGTDYVLLARRGMEGFKGNGTAATGGTGNIAPDAGVTTDGGKGQSGGVLNGGRGGVPNMPVSVNTIGERADFAEAAGRGSDVVGIDGVNTARAPVAGFFGGGGGGGITSSIFDGIGITTGAGAGVPLARATWLYKGN